MVNEPVPFQVVFASLVQRHRGCEPLISEAMPCFARAVLTVDEQFFEGVDMAGESDRHDCWIISGSKGSLEFY